MIAFSVSHNGKHVCTAGADDLTVLSAIITAHGKLGKKTVPARPDDLQGEIYYSVGGLTRRKDPKKDVHMDWRSLSKLKIGDIIQVKVLETTKVDKPIRRKNAEKRRKKANQAIHARAKRPA